MKLSRLSRSSIHRRVRLIIVGVRWWFGLTYLLAGVGGLIAGPLMIARGNYGGIYMLIGSALLAGLGWVVHPWGFQCRSGRHSL